MGEIGRLKLVAHERRVGVHPAPADPRRVLVIVDAVDVGEVTRSLVGIVQEPRVPRADERDRPVVHQVPLLVRPGPGTGYIPLLPDVTVVLHAKARAFRHRALKGRVHNGLILRVAPLAPGDHLLEGPGRAVPLGARHGHQGLQPAVRRLAPGQADADAVALAGTRVGHEGRYPRSIGPQVDIHAPFVAPDGLGELLPKVRECDGQGRGAGEAEHTGGLLTGSERGACCGVDLVGKAPGIAVRALPCLKQPGRVGDGCGDVLALGRREAGRRTGQWAGEANGDAPELDGRLVSGGEEPVLQECLGATAVEVDAVVKRDGPRTVRAREAPPEPHHEAERSGLLNLHRGGGVGGHRPLPATRVHDGPIHRQGRRVGAGEIHCEGRAVRGGERELRWPHVRT